MLELTKEVLETIITRIVDVAHPDKVIMFGSHARGEANSDSDVDLLVIVSGDIHRRKTTQAIYMNLIGVGYPADIIVLRKEDVAKYADSIGTIVPTALREGKVVYAA